MASGLLPLPLLQHPFQIPQLPSGSTVCLREEQPPIHVSYILRRRPSYFSLNRYFESLILGMPHFFGLEPFSVLSQTPNRDQNVNLASHLNGLRFQKLAADQDLGLCNFQIHHRFLRRLNFDLLDPF